MSKTGEGGVARRSRTWPGLSWVGEGYIPAGEGENELPECCFR